MKVLTIDYSIPGYKPTNPNLQQDKLRERLTYTLGTVAELWSISKRLISKQSLIYMRLSFKNNDFNNKLYFLIQIKQHFFKRYCLKIHNSLNNPV